MSATPDPARPPAPPRDPLAAPLWHAQDAVRFTDADGVAWRVVECASAHVPGARGPRCLLFFSEGVARRVWVFPPHWRALPPSALDALMRRV